MNKLYMIMISASLALAGCETTTCVTAVGQQQIKIYRISSLNQGKIARTILEDVNKMRTTNNHSAMAYDATLNLAAAVHSKDMAAQARPWHWGSDGSSPKDRTEKAGYKGEFLGELISETYETEVETLAAWTTQSDTMAILMDERAQDLGFAWYQEPNGKIWWTLISGKP